MIVGPSGDPADVADASDAADAFGRIRGGDLPFVSRGDESGTHMKERSIWRELDVEPVGDWYVSAGQGMGAVLVMADEKRAYTLVDRGTYLAFRGRIDLTVLLDGDPGLHNPYGVIAVNPEHTPGVEFEAATTFIEWLTSPEAQDLIGGYALHGEVLFHPHIVRED